VTHDFEDWLSRARQSVTRSNIGREPFKSRPEKDSTEHRDWAGRLIVVGVVVGPHRDAYPAVPGVCEAEDHRGDHHREPAGVTEIGSFTILTLRTCVPIFENLVIPGTEACRIRALRACCAD